MDERQVRRDMWWGGFSSPTKALSKPHKNTKNKVSDNSSIPGWAKIREKILNRDDYRCRICGDDCQDASLNVHHIDWGRSHNQSSNLVTLCRHCHQAIHREGYKPELFEDWPTPWGKVE